MASRHFRIDVGESNTSEEGISFDLAGVVDGEPWVESFETLPAMPAGIFADLQGWTFPVGRCVDFLTGILQPDSEERFRVLIHDKRRMVKDIHLYELARRIIEELTGFPTTPPSTSPNGASTIGATSAGG